MTTTAGEPAGEWQPGAPFVVACPACAGHLGVPGQLAGQVACCPLCAATFHIPNPHQPDAPPPPLSTLAAVPRHPVRQVSASDSTVTAWGPASRLMPQFVPQPMPAPQPATEADGGLGVAASTIPAPLPTPIFPLPAAGAMPPSNPELQFREPVLTVGRHGHEKELRRLSAEERRVRRGRRNIVMLLVGVAVLLVIVLVISMQGQQADRGGTSPVTDSPQ